MAQGIFQIVDFAYHTIQPVNLTLSPGTCIGICGPSGSGKTLFLRSLVDLEDHSGMVMLENEEMTKFKPHQWRKKVGMLPAESQWWYDTVGEHFRSPDVDLSALGLTPEVMSWPVIRLSSGEKQRLGLLRLLQNQPRVLLLDEPTSNLDAHHTRQVESLLKEYCREQAAAMIWVSHDESQLRRVAAPVYCLRDRNLQEVAL